MTDTPPPRLSEELLSVAESAAQSGLTLGELMDRLEGRVYTLFLILLSLPMCQPIPLPGLSTPFGVIIALLGLRFALRKRPWLPRRLRTTRLTTTFFPAVLRGSGRLLGKFEKLLHPRLSGIFHRRTSQFIVGAIISFCGLLLLLPLPVPGSNMLPALTVILAAAAYSEQDGYCLIAAAVVFLVTLGFFAALTWGGVEAISCFV